MAALSNSIFVIWAKPVFQSPGLIEDFPAGGGLVSDSDSKTVDNFHYGRFGSVHGWVQQSERLL